MKDLVILVADKNMQFALKGALSRTESLNIRPIETEFIVHPGRDGGARKSGPELLRLERPRFTHALLVFDFEGCGTTLPNAEAVEHELDPLLANHWGACGKSIVIYPELEVWAWGSNNALHQAIDWQASQNVREWLRQEGFSFDSSEKPTRPKEALQSALRETGLPRSSAVYQEIAETISLINCLDDAFIRLRQTLSRWFSP